MVSAGPAADNTAAAIPAKQTVVDTPRKILPNANGTAAVT